MSVQHSTLSSTQLHESKGLSASSDKEYNHASSGVNSWEIIIGATSGTASASSEVDITNLGDYSVLIITFQDLLPASSGIPRIRFSSDNGSTFNDTSIYYLGLNQDGTGSMDTSFTQLALNTTTEAAYHTGKIIVSNFNKAVPSAVYGHVSTTTGANFTTAIAGRGIKGFVNSATAWNAIRVFNFSGDLTSGKIIIEGIKS